MSTSTIAACWCYASLFHLAARLDDDLLVSHHFALARSELFHRLDNVHAGRDFAKDDMLATTCVSCNSRRSARHSEKERTECPPCWAGDTRTAITKNVKRWTYSSQSHLSTVVMKNCDPLELGPELADDNRPISRVSDISLVMLA